jgi:hypothetical protein
VGRSPGNRISEGPLFGATGLTLLALLGCSGNSSSSLAAFDAAQDAVFVGADAVSTEAASPSTIEAPDSFQGDLNPGPVCDTAFAGCLSFVDATAADSVRTIRFQDYSYDPKCLMVRAGQLVAFSGDFNRHPLTPSCGPDLLLEYRGDSTSASFAMPAVGLYGYYCLDHGNPQGEVMSGAIKVVP